MEDPSRRLHRSACAECQRRKQKCNREWPCNHCQKRKVADKCTFANPVSPTEKPNPIPRTKRSRAADDDSNEENGSSSDTGDDDVGLEAIGYMAGPLLNSLELDTKKSKKSMEKLDWVTPDKSPILKKALDALPPRPQMDIFVQLFFANVNYHYYIVYPPKFTDEYQEWWASRSNDEPVTLQWTCLLLSVCACATQHLDEKILPQVEADMGMTARELTELYCNLTTDLANAIPSGRYHLLNIQRMLHTCYWYKAEARFVEAWHLIGASVRESQELGLPRDSDSAGLSEFEREMRRRVWCIVATWDWQFASGLCRPTMIDHTDVDVKSPTLTLENLNPSPLLHMKLQSEAITQLAARFSAPKNVRTPAEIQQYKVIIESWMRSFPNVYNIDAPDTSRDHSHPWATAHRFYLHTMAYLMILNPIRAYMSKPCSKASPPEELQIRADGVYYSLRNLATTTLWTQYSSHSDGRYHFIIFSLFDTASVLCAAILKDEDQSIPRREEILLGIENSVNLLKRINNLSKTAKTSYDILSRIARRLPKSKAASTRKRAKIAKPSPVPKVKAEPKAKPASKVESAPTPVAPTYAPRAPAHEEVVPMQTQQGYHSDSTSPSNFASSVTAGSSPQSNAGGPESYASSTPDSAPSIDERTMTSYTTQNTSLPYDGSLDPAVSIGSMIQNNMGMVMDSSIMVPQPAPLYTDLQPPVPEMVQGFGGIDPITDAELGEFNRLWDWQSLDFDFISSEAVNAGAMPQPQH